MNATTATAQRPFEIFGLNPGSLPPRLALALARNGATGVLDLVHVADAALSTAHFHELARQTDARIGLRLGPSQLAQAVSLLSAATDRSFIVILAADEPAVQQQMATTLREANGGLSLWAEITSAEAAATFSDSVDGLIALGHEAGGWVGEDTSFILLQKLQGRTLAGDGARRHRRSHRSGLPCGRRLRGGARRQPVVASGIAAARKLASRTCSPQWRRVQASG